MSACRCPHCSATGRCQCYECMEAARGARYVTQHRMNRDVLGALTFATEANNGQFPLLGLLFLSRAIAGAAQADETYPCNVCKGAGYNYIGGGRR